MTSRPTGRRWPHADGHSRTCRTVPSRETHSSHGPATVVTHQERRAMTDVRLWLRLVDALGAGRLAAMLLVVAVLVAAAPAAVVTAVPGAEAAGQRSPVAGPSVSGGCALYPIALHAQSLVGVAVGATVPDITQG